MIDAIYATTATPECWPDALAAIAQLFDAKGALLIIQRQDQSLATVVSASLLAAQKDYESVWWQEDFLTYRAILHGYMAGGNVVRDVDISTEEERQNHSFYSDFRKKHELGPLMAGSISPSPTTKVFLSIQRKLGAPDFGQQDMDRMGPLLRHCERALMLTSRMEQMEATNATLDNMLASIGCAVFGIDEHGRVATSNPAARGLVGEHLQLRAGRLSPAHHDARRMLDSAIVSALRGVGESPQTCAHPIKIGRGEGQRPMIAYVIPLRYPSAATVTYPLRRMAALVLVVDLDGTTTLDPALVRDYLGLTLGEARIAAHVALGVSPREIAERLGISEQTVRTTLKRVFSKSGISRQSELSALLARLGLMAQAPG